MAASAPLNLAVGIGALVVQMSFWATCEEASTHVSLSAAPEESAPPNTIILPVDELNTAACRSRAAGGPPVGCSCVQAGVPPRPLALVSIHAVLDKPALVLPPKMVMVLATGS